MERNRAYKDNLVIGINYDFSHSGDVKFNNIDAPNQFHEKTNSSTIAIYLSYGLSDKLSVEFILPWRSVINESINHPLSIDGKKYIRSANGLSDAMILSRYGYYFSNDEILVNIGGGLKLASGKINAMDTNDKLLDNVIQVGSGTMDPIFLFFTAYSKNRWLYSANFFAKIAGHENLNGYKFGNEFHGKVGFNYDKSDNIIYKNYLSFVHTQRDISQYGTEVMLNRGGFWMFYNPGIGFRMRNNLLLDVEIPISIYNFVN